MNIGIDLGGTNIAAAIVDNEGNITKRAEIQTESKGGSKSIIDGLVNVCRMLLEDTGLQPASIGIGVPGAINNKKGEVIFTPNLPLRDICITEELREKYNCPIHLGNDANCAALGETVAGGAKGAKDVVLITLGTGLGGGVILNGRLHTGLSGAAGELGHMVILKDGRECGCGRFGCWERYASATGLIATAIEFMGAYRESLLWELCDGSAANIDGKIIFKAFRLNDIAAHLTVELYVEHLAAGIANIINILEPELICIGGGISNAWDCFSELLQELVNIEKFPRFPSQQPGTQISKALLGNNAGIIGAAALGW